MKGNWLQSTQVAKSVPFDNLTNGFPSTSTNVQTAIENSLNFNPQNNPSVLFDDFDGRMSWFTSVSGVGSIADVGGANTLLSSGKHLGIANIAYGLSGHAAIGLPGSLARTTVFGNGQAEYITLIRIETLATLTEDYVFRCGYGTSLNSDHLDGIYFEYNRNQSVNWLLKTASNSSRTTNISSISVVEDQWIQLKWIVNSAGNEVSFFINNSSAGTITTNLPTVAGRPCGPSYHIVSTNVVSGGRRVFMDYFYFNKKFTSRD